MPANRYYANLGRRKLQIKAILNYILKKKGKEKKYNSIQKETNTLHVNSSTGILLFENRVKLQLEVYTTIKIFY